MSNRIDSFSGTLYRVMLWEIICPSGIPFPPSGKHTSLFTLENHASPIPWDLIDLQVPGLCPPAQHPTPQALHVPPSAEGACDPDGPVQVLSSQARVIGFEMAIFLETFYIDAERPCVCLFNLES